MVNGDGMVNGFGEPSIGLDGMAMVFNGFGEQSIGLDGMAMVFNGFGEPSIGLDEMSTVFNGSHLMVGKQASIGVNQVTMVFGETTTGLGGFQW